MSGAEVAGLILAVMPLFISALEDYNNGLDPVKSFLRWERELPSFIRKLRNQHVHYEQTLRLLLAPITTEFELAEMIAEPGGKLWTWGGKGEEDMEVMGRETVGERLRERLGEGWDAYMGVMGDVERIMGRIAAKLDLERASSITKNDLEAMLIANPRQANQKYEFRKRVRFGMNKKHIKALLEELDGCNKELERFTDRSEKLEPFRKASKPSFAKRLQRIQLYAKNLHQVLVQSWSCSCKATHCTNLQLEQRIGGYAKGVVRKKGDEREFCFTVAFSGDPGVWQEAEIQMLEQEVDCPPEKPKLSKGVSWSSTITAPPPYSEVAEPGFVPDEKTLQEINDLCSAIKNFQISVPCIGFSLDEKSQKLRGAYPVTPRNEKAVGGQGLVSLDELLTHPPVVNGRPAKLTKRERYSLAVTLASSTLQLNATPWFNDQWSKKDIVFHRISNGTRPVDIEHPYVTQHFHEAQKNGVIVNGKLPSRAFHNKNTILLALAVALLELYFGVSAEQYQGGELFPTGGQMNPWTICAMAYEWTETERENLSAAFLAAVTHCLRCFGDPGSSLQDPVFLQAAVEGILMPLQDELAQFLGKNAP